MSEALERLRKWIARQPMTGATGGGNHTGLDLLGKALDEMEARRVEEREQWETAARAEGFAAAKEQAASLAEESTGLLTTPARKQLAHRIRGLQDGHGEGA